MECIGIDGVVEIGHAMILEAEGHADPDTTIRAAMVGLFGAIQYTALWKIKGASWVMWNVVQTQYHGQNKKAQRVIMETAPSFAWSEEVKEILSTIGGCVAILNEKEKDLVLQHTQTSTNHLVPDFYFIHGPTDDNSRGGIGTVL